jgi:hypothetical protein
VLVSVAAEEKELAAEAREAAAAAPAAMEEAVVWYGEQVAAY